MASNWGQPFPVATSHPASAGQLRSPPKLGYSYHAPPFKDFVSAAFAEAVAEIAKASGRTIRYRQISPEDYSVMLEQQGVPADVAPFLLYLFTTVLDGRNAYLTDGVERALGRKPRDFETNARETAAAGIWRA